jgi:hypothetical protein
MEVEAEQQANPSEFVVNSEEPAVEDVDACQLY